MRMTRERIKWQAGFDVLGQVWHLLNYHSQLWTGSAA
jgi:hypothetical protein